VANVSGQITFAVLSLLIPFCMDCRKGFVATSEIELHHIRKVAEASGVEARRPQT